MSAQPVAVDGEVVDEVRQRVGDAALAGYVTDAVRRQLQHDRIGDYLAEAEATSGPIPDDLLQEARQIWQDTDDQRDDAQPG